MEIDFRKSIYDLAEALNKHEVKYMFVGGIAINYYATPRISSGLPKDIEYDIDVWYSATSDNFIKLINGISEINPELKSDLDKIVFDPKRTFIKFNVAKFHFDFLPELAAFHRKDFNQCYANRVVGKIDGVKINIISKTDLLFEKEKLGRDKDLADIQNLKKNSYTGFSR